MVFFAVFGLILILGLSGRRPSARTWLLVAAAAAGATLYEVLS